MINRYSKNVRYRSKRYSFKSISHTKLCMPKCLFNFSENHLGSYREIIDLLKTRAQYDDFMTREMEIKPVTASGAIKSLGIVLVLCFIALLVILGIDFALNWEKDFKFR